MVCLLYWYALSVLITLLSSYVLRFENTTYIFNFFKNGFIAENIFIFALSVENIITDIGQNDEHFMLFFTSSPLNY